MPLNYAHFKRLAVFAPLLCAFAMGLVPEKSIADEKKDAQAQTKRLQQMQKQLEQVKQAQLASEKEKAEVKTVNSALDEKLKATSGKLGQLKSRLSEAERKIALLTEQLTSVTETRDALSLKLADTEKRLTDTSQSLDKSESGNNQLNSKLGQTTQKLAQCEVKNQEMAKYGNEMVTKYRLRACNDSWLSQEPFTKLKQVEIENTAENYREKIDQNDLFSQIRK